jgi:hypothetical protein
MFISLPPIGRVLDDFRVNDIFNKNGTPEKKIKCPRSLDNFFPQEDPRGKVSS